MSITRGVLAQSPEPEARDKVLDNKQCRNRLPPSRNRVETC